MRFKCELLLFRVFRPWFVQPMNKPGRLAGAGRCYQSRGRAATPHQALLAGVRVISALGPSDAEPAAFKSGLGPEARSDEQDSARSPGPDKKKTSRRAARVARPWHAAGMAAHRGAPRNGRIGSYLPALA